MRVPAAVIRRPFSSAAVVEFAYDPFKYNLQQILSMDRKVRKQGVDHFRFFLSYVTPSDASTSFLNPLDPNFKHGLACYSSVLSVLAERGVPIHLRKAVTSMTPKCTSVQESLFVVDFWRQHSKRYSYQLKYRLTSKTYNDLFKLLARFGQIGEMKRLYTDMLDLMVSPGVYSYNLIINGYCKLGYVVEARQYVCKMIQAGLDLDYHTFTSFVLGHCRRMDLASAFQAFEEMPCTRNAVSYNHLIHCLCDAGKVDEALSLFARMKDDSLDPTKYTYNALIKGLCTKNVHKAMRLFHEMRERGLVPRLPTYNLLIAGQCRSGNFDTAYRLLGLVEQKLVPNHQTYGCLIDFLCRSKRVEEARALFDSFGKKWRKANVNMYNFLIDGYCKAGKLDDARALFQEMETAGCCLPDSYTFTALIHGLCSDGNLKEALSMVEKMAGMGLQPAVCTRTVLIRKMLKEGDFGGARACFHDMSSSGHKPDAQSYNCFVEAYCSAGRVREAEDMVEKMKGDGVSPDVFTYTLLIKAYGRLGMTSSAFDALKRMSDDACEPSHHTFLALIKHLFAKKYPTVAITWKTVEFDLVVELFEKMVDHGCTPDAKCYEELIFGMCKVQNLRIAQRLLDLLPLPPSEMVSNAILRCCCKLQKHEEAAEVVENMIRGGQSPELEYCKTVVLGLYQRGEKQRGMSVFEKLLRCGGYYDDEIAWKILIDGVLKQGHVDAFSELFQAMQDNGCQFSPQTHLSLTQRKTDPTVAIGL